MNEGAGGAEAPWRFFTAFFLGVFVGYQNNNNCFANTCEIKQFRCRHNFAYEKIQPLRETNKNIVRRKTKSQTIYAFPID
jgi:hypothetical protein